jgi:hypothetical protein
MIELNTVLVTISPFLGSVSDVRVLHCARARA